MLRVWCLFYYTLFTAASLVTSDQDFFISSICRTLSSRDRDLCEGSVTEEECKVALHQMKNNKSPGKDGLPYESYKHFWSLLGPDLVAVFNSSYNSGLLPRSQRSALISLLYKKGDRRILRIGDQFLYYVRIIRSYLRYLPIA